MRRHRSTLYVWLLFQPQLVAPRIRQGSCGRPGSTARRLWVYVFAGNAASVRILEGLAFRQEGLALQSLYLRDSWHDILSFAQLRSEWLANQSA